MSVGLLLCACNFCLTKAVSDCLSVCPSVSVCLSICLFPSACVHLSVRSSVHPSVSVCVHSCLNVSRVSQLLAGAHIIVIPRVQGFYAIYNPEGPGL